MNYYTMTDPEGIEKIDAAISIWIKAEYNYNETKKTTRFIESIMQSDELQNTTQHILSYLSDIERIRMVSLRRQYVDASYNKDRVWSEEAYIKRSRKHSGK